MNLFKYNPIEKQILEMQTVAFSSLGFNTHEARKTAKAMLNKAIQGSKKDGTYHLPSNFGNIILGEQKAENEITEKFAKIIRKNFDKKRAEGVRDEDIKWFWNLNDIERRVMDIQADFSIGYLIERLCSQEGLTIKEAIVRAHKFFPRYGNPDDITHASGEDRPLPYELRDRINIYTEKRHKDNPEKIKKEKELSSSFNALIRKEIKAGNL